MTDVAAWLKELGLERYEPAFRESEITTAVLPELTEADLKELWSTSWAAQAAATGDRLAAAKLGVRADAGIDNHLTRGRAAAADGAVLRPGRLDRAVAAARPGRDAEGPALLSELRGG